MITGLAIIVLMIAAGAMLIAILNGETTAHLDGGITQKDLDEIEAAKRRDPRL